MGVGGGWAGGGGGVGGEEKKCPVQENSPNDGSLVHESYYNTEPFKGCDWCARTKGLGAACLSAVKSLMWVISSPPLGCPCPTLGITHLPLAFKGSF